MPTCYLAGPITGLTYEACTAWRAEATRMLAAVGITCLSPMRGEERLLEHDVMPYATVSPLGTPVGILARDRFDVQRADVVLANLLGATRASVGTCIELGWADAWRKPVVLVMEPEGNPHNVGMVKALCAYRGITLAQGVNVVRAILGVT